jgi:hypothetical protein
VVKEKLQRYQNLVRSQAWEELVKIGEGQLNVRKNMLESMSVRTQEDIADYNFAKGEIGGIKLFLSFPDLLIEEAKEILGESTESEDGSDTE